MEIEQFHDLRFAGMRLATRTLLAQGPAEALGAPGEGEACDGALRHPGRDQRKHAEDRRPRHTGHAYRDDRTVRTNVDQALPTTNE